MVEFNPDPEVQTTKNCLLLQYHNQSMYNMYLSNRLPTKTSSPDGYCCTLWSDVQNQVWCFKDKSDNSWILIITGILLPGKWMVKLLKLWKTMNTWGR